MHDSVTAPDATELTEDIGGTLLLGDDSDCESCGSTCNQVEWNLMDDEIHLISSIGCYGGDNLTTSDLEEAGAFITKTAERFSLLDAEVSAAIAEMRDRVTAHRAQAG